MRLLIIFMFCALAVYAGDGISGDPLPNGSSWDGSGDTEWQMSEDPNGTRIYVWELLPPWVGAGWFDWNPNTDRYERVGATGLVYWFLFDVGPGSEDDVFVYGFDDPNTGPVVLDDGTMAQTG